jgi:hypothetical protein
MASDGREPERRGVQSVNWRRFAMLFSGVITGIALIRLAADAAGIARGTTGSAVVSALSNFAIIFAIALATPYIVTGVRPRPLWRRLVVALPIAGVYALFNFWLLQSSL